MTADDLKDALILLKNDEKAVVLQRFFKTGKGQYAEGDIFWGVSMPELRVVSKSFETLPKSEISKLVHDPVHELRMCGLLILTFQMKKAKTEQEKVDVFNTYVQNIDGVNNWDLVDVTAPGVIGAFLMDRDKSLLYEFARSQQLWKQRVSIISTLHFIKKKHFSDTLSLAEMMLDHKHDLMHKAIGWMLREIGKIDQKTEEDFLMKHCKTMPRTMLRYAIERFDEDKRQAYLKGLV